MLSMKYDLSLRGTRGQVKVDLFQLAVGECLGILIKYSKAKAACD